MPQRFSVLALFLAGAAFAAAQQPAPTPNPFSRVVVLGDSASAGFQNGSLLDAQQTHGWASLVAKQAGFPLTLPLVGAPGYPAVFSVAPGSYPPILEEAPGFTKGRENPTTVPDVLAVPGAFVQDVLHAAPGGVKPIAGDAYMERLVLGSGGSQVQQALARDPTTIFLWVGNNDALKADGLGDPTAMTPVADFTDAFTQLMDALHTGSSARLVVANIPDVTKLPYMTDAGTLLGEMSAYTHVPESIFSAAFNLYPGDMLNWKGLQDLKVDWDGIFKGVYPTPIPANEVLTPTELAQVRSTIDGYNQAIAAQTKAAGGVLVDLHTAVDGWAQDGVTIGDQKATMLYMGGMFGVDGLHPSNTGYALFANVFIDAMNAQLGMAIKDVDLQAVAAKDPYFKGGH